MGKIYSVLDGNIVHLRTTHGEDQLTKMNFMVQVGSEFQLVEGLFPPRTYSCHCMHKSRLVRICQIRCRENEVQRNAKKLNCKHINPEIQSYVLQPIDNTIL
jgi:hypothetical protein